MNNYFKILPKFLITGMLVSGFCFSIQAQDPRERNYLYPVLKPIHRGIDPGGQPNTDGLTYKIEAYLNDGTFLWQKDLGPGIEPGIWYSPMIVYDLDGDEKAEIAVKTGPSDAREADGRVCNGPEWCSILNGIVQLAPVGAKYW